MTQHKSSKVDALAVLVREFRQRLLAGGFTPQASVGELAKGDQWIATTYGNWEFQVVLWTRYDSATRSPRQTVRVWKAESGDMLADLAEALVAENDPVVQALMAEYDCRTAVA